MAQPTRRSRPRTAAPSSRRLPADLKAALAAAIDKKAIDLVLLDLRKASAFTDFFVIATGTSTRQVQAIADAVQEALKARHLRPALVEGYAQAEWILIDYFDFIVHVFVPARREFYALERLWGDAERIEISEK
jgi:ribosome-associated protein